MWDQRMAEMLELWAHLPQVAFAPGDVIVREGGAAGPIWVLVSGSLRVRKGNALVNTGRRSARPAG
jgi:CRP-like cAMP-binding protein